MSTYQVFAGAAYEAGGGYRDFVGQFPTLNEAKACEVDDCDWGQIAEDGRVVLVMVVERDDGFVGPIIRREWVRPHRWMNDPRSNDNVKWPCLTCGSWEEMMHDERWLQAGV